MLRLYDGLNHVRRLMEKDGRAPRSLINQMIALPADDVAVWCWDAPNAKAARQKVFPPYKAKRMPPPDNLWPTIDLIRQALLHTRAIQIKVDGFEADDVIATMCRRYPDQKIEVFSNDGDLRQLCINPNVTIGASNKQPPHLVRLYKTFVGDASDNIPGVKSFGDKAWDNASKDALFNLVDDAIAGRAFGTTDLAHLSTRSQNWLNENRAQLATMWTITGLLDIPPDLLANNTRAGDPDPVAASAILTQFYL